MGKLGKPFKKQSQLGKQGHKVGKPLAYETPQLLQEAIDKYFNDCEINHKNPTINGLALALDFCDYTQLYDYRKRPEYSIIVKRALMRVRANYEQFTMTTSSTGSIFMLKVMGMREDNNYFKDESEQPQNKDEMIAHISKALDAMGLEIRPKTTV